MHYLFCLLLTLQLITCAKYVCQTTESGTLTSEKAYGLFNDGNYTLNENMILNFNPNGTILYKTNREWAIVNGKPTFSRYTSPIIRRFATYVELNENLRLFCITISPGCDVLVKREFFNSSSCDGNKTTDDIVKTMRFGPYDVVNCSSSVLFDEIERTIATDIKFMPQDAQLGIDIDYFSTSRCFSSTKPKVPSSKLTTESICSRNERFINASAGYYCGFKLEVPIEIENQSDVIIPIINNSNTLRNEILIIFAFLTILLLN